MLGTRNIIMVVKQVINEPEIRQQASVYEEGKPLTEKTNAKTNKIKVSKRYNKKYYGHETICPCLILKK